MMQIHILKNHFLDDFIHSVESSHAVPAHTHTSLDPHGAGDADGV